MKRSISGFIVSLIVLFSLGACTRSEQTEDQARSQEFLEQAGSGELVVSSSVFDDGADIPIEYANTGIEGGLNISLPLFWENTSAETRSFSLLMRDQHPMAQGFVHWLVIDIPAAVTAIPAQASGTDEMGTTTRELMNDFGRSGYGGPQPPAGSGAHEYQITLFALDVESLPLGGSASEAELLAAMEGHVLDSASLTGLFESRK